MNVEIVGNPNGQADQVLDIHALRFVAELEKTFGGWRRLNVPWDRQKRKRLLAEGKMEFSFSKATSEIRKNLDWQIGWIPQDLRDRRVEITGPASSMKMVVNALNSGASCYMADAEDSESPTWENIVNGQFNLFRAIRAKPGEALYTSPEGKEYELNEKTATLIFRPRGLHLAEKHLLVDGRPVSASLFDFGMYFYLNAAKLLGKGSGSYFYLPKLESCDEAHFWKSVFSYAETRLNLGQGKIKATVLIETLPAAFEMEEILYALRPYIVGLNCGRWDYIFSCIKNMSHRSDLVFPDRSELTMDKGFLKSYVDLLVKTCHHRGAYAIGGMSAYIQSKDETANNHAFLKVKSDKAREVAAGCDGAWVAHPGLVAVVREVFNLKMSGQNQLDVLREDVNVTAGDLLNFPQGSVTVEGLRNNISVSLQYLAAWLGGKGCVPINNLMEDAATVEISRAQVWQWVKNKIFEIDKVRDVIAEEVGKLSDSQAAWTTYDLAANIFDKLVSSEEFAEFMTVPAYEFLLGLEGKEVSNGLL